MIQDSSYLTLYGCILLHSITIVIGESIQLSKILILILILIFWTNIRANYMFYCM